MFLSRQFALAVAGSLLIFGAAMIGCTGSEPYVMPAPGTGGSPGTGGTVSGTGGAGTGGTVGGTGGTVAGTGGAGTGGAAMDAAVDRPRDATAEVAMEAGGMLTFAKDISPILTRVCGGCHGNAGGMMVGMLTSVTGTVSAAHTACAKVDASKKRIVAGMPAASYLYAKITMTTAQLGANCGAAMPAAGMLTMPEKTMIGTWIMQGAM
jgi:hypothetical protein